jgi:hypothetical protein
MAPSISELSIVSEQEFDAFDPQSNNVMRVRESDSVRRARMRASLKQNSYSALSKGFFGAEEIDPNNNTIFNFSRELGRSVVGFGMNLPANAEIIGNANQSENLDKALQAVEKYNGRIFTDADVEKMREFVERNKAELSENQQNLFKRVERNNERMTRWFGENRDTFMGDLGGGVGNLGMLIGASALAGPAGATAVAAGIGINTTGSNYKELVEGGMDEDSAMNRALATGITEAALERIGIGLLWKTTGKRMVQRVIRGFVVEGSEEGFQNLTEDMIMNKVRGKSIGDILYDTGYASLIGGIVGMGGGAVAGGNTWDRAKAKDELVARGMTEPQAESILSAIESEAQNEKSIVANMNEVLSDQIDTAQYPDDDFDKAMGVWQAIGQDAVAAAKAEIDIRDEVRARTQGLDEQSQNIVADQVQGFADAMAQDFGISQREVLDITGLTIQSESPALDDEGYTFNDKGELVSPDGKVLFQSAANPEDVFIQKQPGGHYSLYVDGRFDYRGRLFDVKSYLQKKGIYGEFDLMDVVSGTGRKIKVAQQSPVRQQMTLDFNKTESAFDRWFGNSKVVDENGKPLVVYHGSNTDFHTFDKEKTSFYNHFGQGHYFTDNKSIADDFSRDDSRHYRVENKIPKTYAVYLRIEKPYYMNQEITDEEIQELSNLVKITNGSFFFKRFFYDSFSDKVYDKASENVPAQWGWGEDEVKAELVNRKDLLELKRWAMKYKQETRIGDYSEGDTLTRLDVYTMLTDNGNAISPKRHITEFLQKNGYDGIIVDAIGSGLKEKDTRPTRNFVVWDANQIKSIDNGGRYSTTSPNIYFQSSAFNNWFGDSKVVDENGNPIIKEREQVYVLDGNGPTGISSFSQRDGHRAPGRDDLSLADVVQGKNESPDGEIGLPSDYFTPAGVRIYAHGREGLQSYNAILDAIDENAQQIKAYRAVPSNLPINEIMNGDWITFSRDYAKMHGESRFDGDYKIIEQIINVEDAWFDGNDINEWGFDNGEQNIDQVFVKIENPAYLDNVPKSFADIVKLRANKNDGVITPDGRVFVENTLQIKSANHNIGTYDPENRNIFFQDEPRGYFDWTNKSQQLIKIMQSGDLDTILHELGHFFSLNYINLAIETGQTEKIQSLMNYYNVSDPAMLIQERIQEDLARKFLTYLKTDESPRGFRKYFDAVKDWLAQMWDSLIQKNLVDIDTLDLAVVEFFDSITNVRPENINLESIRANKADIKQMLKDIRNNKSVKIGDLDLREIEELIKVANMRLPRAPKSLYSKMWGRLNRKWAMGFDIHHALGISDNKRLMNLYFSPKGISQEDEFLEFLVREIIMFGDSWDNNSVQDSQDWDRAMDFVSRARNVYSLEDYGKIQDIQHISRMKDEASDILDGIDGYDALAHIKALRKKNIAFVSKQELDAALKRLNVLESDYKRLTRRMVRQAKSDIDGAKKSAVNFLMAQDIPADTKNHFFRKINSVRDMKSLTEFMQDVREHAHRKYSEMQARAQSDQIQRELAQTFSRNKKRQKYDYENNKLFKQLREYNRMTKSQAWNEYINLINEKPLGTRDRADELMIMFLSYKEKGMSGFSPAFGEKLLFEIQAAKQIALKAKDELEFERGMRRIDTREAVLDAIDKNKKPTAVQRLFLHFGANFKTALDMITDSTIADELDMVPLETQAAIDGRKRINEFLDDTGARIFGFKSRREFLEQKQKWLEPIKGLRIRSLEPSGRIVYQPDVSRGQIMNLYNQYKNKDSIKAMDHWYGKDQILDLVGMLTEQERQFCDEMMSYIDDVYALVNPVYVDVYQTDMNRVFNYWPRRSEHIRDQDLLSDFVGPAQHPQFTKHRSQGAKPVFRMDALSVWMNHEMDAQYMIHQARNFKKISDVFRDPTIENEIRNKWGEKALKVLQEQIDSMSANGVRQSRNLVENMVAQAVGQFAIAKIAVNPLVLAGQMSAYHAYSNYMPTGKYYAELAHAISRPQETHRFMKENVGEFLEERLHGGFNETLKSMMDFEKTGAARAKLNSYLTGFVRYGDYASIVWGGAPRLKYLLNEKDDTGALVRTRTEAQQQFIKETQEMMQSSVPSSLSAWQRSKGIAKVFTIFKNQQNQFVRKIFEAWSEYGRGEIKRGQLIKQIANFAVIQAALFAAFRYAMKYALQLTGDDDNLGEDIFEEIALGSFDIVPFVRDIAQQELRRLDKKSVIGGVSVLGVDDVYKSFQIMHKRKKDWHDYTQIISPFIEMSSGLPVAQYNRYLKKWGF